MTIHENLNAASILSKPGFSCRYHMIDRHNYAVGRDDKSVAECTIGLNLYYCLAVDSIDFLPDQKLLGIYDPSKHQQSEQQNKRDLHSFTPVEVFDPMPTLLREGGKL